MKGAAYAAPVRASRHLRGFGVQGVLCHQPVIEGVARSAAPQFIELVSKLANHFFPVRLFVDEHDASALVGQDRIGFTVVCHRN
jgi:hypothetical protein